jgi:hypothetical protein
MGKPMAAYRVSGPLQPFARGFLFWLSELGYEWTAQRARLRLMAELSSCMAARGVEPAGLTLALVEVSRGCARPGVGDAVVLANVGATVVGVSARLGVGAGAGGVGGERSARPAGG